MSTNSGLARLSLRVLGAAALLTASTLVSQRADALSPVNPGLSPAGNAAAADLTVEVRGHGSGGGSSGHGAGSGGRSFGAAVVGGSAIGAGVAATGAPRFAGHAFVHRRHVRGVFIGGVYYDDYPYDDDYYDYPAVDPATIAGTGCRRVITVQGPRIVCYHRVARHHRLYARHHYSRHHHA